MRGWAHSMKRRSVVPDRPVPMTKMGESAMAGELYPMMVALDPVKFIARHGVVLASGKGPVPCLAEAVAGEPIRGSWWSHPKGQEIFRALGAADDSPDVLRFRLVGAKITLVHRRLWPALVRLADELGKDALAVLRQEHT